MSNAFAGVGTQFKRGDGASSESFTAIAEIKQISFDGLTREIYDTTNLDSSNGWREKLAGFRDGGQVTLNMNFTRDSYDDFLVDFGDDDSVNYEIVLSDSGATTFDFAGYVVGIPFSVQTDDVVSATVTIQTTGEVTLTS